MSHWTGSWAGGRTFTNRDGKTGYWLQRTRHGHGYSFALDGIRSESDALAELALFNRDPAAYYAEKMARRKPKIDDDSLVLSDDLLARWDDYQRGRGRTPKHVKDLRRYLDWWRTKLKGADLRDVSLSSLWQMLDSEATARRNRIVTLKALCKWLRESGRLPRQKDPSLDLKPPPLVPEKALREKGYSMEHVSSAYAALTWFPPPRRMGPFGKPKRGLSQAEAQGIRDVLLLHAKTGMHHTELERIARGEGKFRPVDHEEIKGTVSFWHKSGRVHCCPLDAQGAAAAKRLETSGAPDYLLCRWAVFGACDRLGLPRIHLGELRHSFVTWSRTWGREVKPAEQGVPLERVSQAVGHHGTRITAMRYDGTTVPPMIAVPVVLQHPDDPPVGGAPALRLVENG